MTTTPASNGAVLTTHATTIQTAQVEICALKVGKKQVTMGLFRQLPFHPMWDLIDRQTWGLRPQVDPWGYVEYWWEGDGRTPDFDKEFRAEERRHLVYAEAGRLYRTVVYPAFPRMIVDEGYDVARRDQLLHVITHASVHEVLRRGAARQHHGWFLHPVCDYSGTLRHRIAIPPVTYACVALQPHDGSQIFEFPCESAVDQVMGRYVAATDREDSWGRRCTQELTALLMDRGVFHMSCEEVQGLTIRALEHQSTQYATWKAAWQTFTALPQVFIAV